MNVKLWACLAVIFSFFPNFDSSAEEIDKTTYIFGMDTRWLSVEKGKFEVFVFDQVKDGCWTNSAAVKTAVELELNRSGYELAGDDEHASNAIFLTSLGFLQSGICVATYSFEVYTSDTVRFYSGEHRVLSLYHSQLWEDSGVLAGGKSKMNSGLKDSYVNMTQEFLVNIAKQKKNVVREIIEKSTDPERSFWENYNLE